MLRILVISGLILGASVALLASPGQGNGKDKKVTHGTVVSTMAKHHGKMPMAKKHGKVAKWVIKKKHGKMAGTKGHGKKIILQKKK